MKMWALMMMAAVTVAYNCTQYDCKPYYIYWPYGTCGRYSTSDEMWYFEDTCNYGEICKQSNSTSSYPDYTCVDIMPTIIYPGAKCGSDYICTNDPACSLGEICPGQKLGESCLGIDKHCAPTLYCDQHFTCQNQKTEGSECAIDSECQLHLGCRLDPDSDSTLGKCTPYFSLRANDNLNSDNFDSHQDISYFCPYLYADYSYYDDYQCLFPLFLNNTSPYRCSSSDDCISSTANTIGDYARSECTCGYNPDGNSYCGLLQGDPEKLEAFNWFQNWIESPIYREKCSEAERLTLGTCAMNYLDEETYTKAFYYKMRSSLHPLIQDSPDCVLRTLFPDYYEIKRRFKLIMESEEVY